MARIKRSLLGYKRSEVEAELGARDRRAAESERELLFLSEMLVSREREVETLKQLLADADARHDRSLKSLERLADRLDELHAQARSQATRIRMKALTEAVKVSEKAGNAMGAIQEIEEAAARVHATELAEGNAGGGSDSPSAAGADSVADEIQALEAAADGSGRPVTDTDGSNRLYSKGGDLGYYQGDVEVEIGPLGDFEQLLGFENAAGSIEGASEISVRRFASGRATVGMRIDEPIELLRELEERAPFEFRVRQTDRRRLVLDIDDESAAA